MTTKPIDIRKSWNSVAKRWASYMQPLFAGDDFIWGPFGPTEGQLKWFPSLNGKNVLVAGCGSGADVCYFASRGARVTGIDISDEQLALSQEQLTQKKLSAKLIRGDLKNVLKLGIPRNSIDLVVSSYAFQYVQDLSALFRGLYRLLKPGGVLVFSLDHPVLYAHYPKTQSKTRNRDAAHYFNYLQERRLEWVFNLTGKSVRAYSYHRTLGTFVQALIAAGFELEACLEPAPEQSGINHHRALQSIAQRVPHTLMFRVKKPIV